MTFSISKNDIRCNVNRMKCFKAPGECWSWINLKVIDIFESTCPKTFWGRGRKFWPSPVLNCLNSHF
jgi:hypothetical protein